MPVGNLKCLVPSSTLQLLEVIGRGAVGIVHKAEWSFRSGKATVAARELPVGSLTKNESLSDELIDRLNAMADLSHPSIIKMFGVVNPASAPMLLFEYADLGSVKTFLQRPPSDLSDHCVITVSMLLEYSVQIAHGLLYLESQTFVHCDLAACNIMRTSGPQVKIADCGVLRLFADRDITKHHRLAWCAPETAESSVFTHATDCWMYAVVLWELFSLGADPWAFENQDQIRALLAEGRLLHRPVLCPQSVYSVMTRCWARQPDDRLHFTAVIDSLNKVALPELTAGRDFNEAGKLSVKNGDVVIVTRSGSELWEGQNKRTGEVGEFPEIVFTLQPLRPAVPDSAAHASGAQQAAQRNDPGKNAPSDPPLIDFGNSEPTSDDAPAKTTPFANWTTFESTTDLPKAAEADPVSSVDTKTTQDADISESNKTIRACSDSSLSSRQASDNRNYSSENFADRRHGMIDNTDYIAPEVDVPDSVLLLPAASHTSLSEPCSPVRMAGTGNPSLLVTTDNVGFSNEGDSRGLHHSLPHSMSERLSWMMSASCENLNSGVGPKLHNNGLSSRAQFTEHLSKASSDSPVYVAGGNAPPVPPRDYPSRYQTPAETSAQKSHSTQQHTEIHPIVQDGQRRSSTHYWLLPEKQRFEPLPCDEETISYVNVPDGRSSREKSARKAAKLKQSAEVSHLQMDDMMKRLDISVADQPLESMGEIRDKVDLIRADVGFDAVTFEESLSALSLNHWSVEEAIRYIKVEHLFRLGIASRDICRNALVAFQWNVMEAASCLVDRQSAPTDHLH